jgi:hypothetical protein
MPTALKQKGPSFPKGLLFYIDNNRTKITVAVLGQPSSFSVQLQKSKPMLLRQ